MLSNYISSEILYTMFLGSSIEQYIIATIYFIASFICLGIIQKVVLKKLEILTRKTENDIDDVIVEIVQSVRPRFYIMLSFYISLQILNLNNITDKIVNVVFLLVIIMQITVSLQLVIRFLANKFSSKDEENGEHTRSATRLLGTIITVFIWVIGILMVLSNIGIDVSSLLAGVGIGGIAIAFALKEILADLFASFSIYFDKPFKAGDAVTIGEHTGTVERIGVKTTRLRSTTGEEIIVSNQDLTSSRVQNFKKMERRRSSFFIKVVRSTSLEKLKMINGIVEEIISGIDNLEFSRCHFRFIDDWSHTFKATYFVNSRDYDEYLNVQEEINFKLCEKLREHKIEMAYPTQTTFEYEKVVE